MDPVVRRLTGILIAVLFCLAPASGRSHEVGLPASPNEVALTGLGGGVYVLHGIQALPDARNKGLISNTGIVLTKDGAVIIDSGGGLAVGRLILDKLRAITDKPVIGVFNTHVHGDHWLGNAAIRERFPKARFYAHEKAIRRLHSGEAQRWLGIFKKMAGKAATGTTAVIPDHALKGGESLDIGGTVFRTHHTGHAHTDSDIMIEAPDHRLLFTGDIVEHGRAVSSDVPQDFDIAGQIKAIEYALTLPVDRFVPGHGRTGGRAIPKAALRFLTLLHRAVQRYYRAGLKDYEMKAQVVRELAEFSGWFGFDQIGRMISFVYLQVEEAEFR